MDWWCDMARLSLWLPPFSPDYSGASAVLFDLKTVTAMHDASGCTGNYTGYDDPRWYGSHSGIFCSGLRQIDAVLGDDEKLIKKMEAAARDIQPDLMALVGSPVPMVIGADLEGIAVELEERTGIPSFGFDTTGTAYYDRGAFRAAKALMDRYTAKQAAKEAAIERRVNILGALPMDFGKGEEIRDFKRFLAENGYETGLCLAMDYSLSDLKEAASAQVNLAVSRFGFLMAQYMEQRFRIPYLCGFPAGESGEKAWLEALERVRETKHSEILNAVEQKDGTEDMSVLIVGEQVMSNSLRYALFREMGITRVTVGCLYGPEPALTLPGDLDLSDEKKIRQAMNRPEYQMIIADPFLKVLLPENTEKKFLPFSQYAVSSKLGEADSARAAGVQFNEWFKRRTSK
ncbi:oxidoreductase [Hungatella hathewayi]|jgi:nitrogenase molybdenum-cofactor synthesis protein NifE|uniref:Oxidoreductase n=2 Tax=Lachnospiraceae TaxID=186803 RepID=A0A374NZL7_9FIRM|nr:nitrogenase component 1 [Hungatella effluvii]RGI97791.1 oxidoreductase [Hungatella hathewayi]RGK97547.1 oxidoreductase [Hungatella hathewayi]RGO73827.1 oxidoreductase [Hungatella hathewayi]